MNHLDPFMAFRPPGETSKRSLAVAERAVDNALTSARWGFKPGVFVCYPLVMTNSLLLKMTIEIVDFPIENGDFP